MTQIIFIFVSLVLALVNATSIKEDLIVTLPDGKIRGAVYLTPNNVSYYGFSGIPYATPPVGSLRLESPQPVKQWDGILNATTESKGCISTSYFQEPEIESEDCLYVSVYVPKIKVTKSLPVMFWIYGGAFQRGNSRTYRYGPDFLIEKDVILVLFNYRVGPLSFISTGDKVLPGNLGLKDQNLALRWTYKNIKYFGGNPQKITIFGQSAGGTSTALHLISKRSAGLFRAAIVQSGSALEYWAADQDPKSKAYALADRIPGGNYGNDTQKLKVFLKSRTVEEIITATKSFGTDDLPMPTLEEESDDAFLTKSNYELLETGNFNQVPVLTGICAEESLALIRGLDALKNIAKSYDTNMNNLIPMDLFPNSSDTVEVYKKIREIHLKGGENFTDNLIAAAKIFSETTFTRGLLKGVELLSKYVRVYLYEFSYYGRPRFDLFLNGTEKASHGSELPFIFNMANISQTTNPQDLLTQNRMVTLWTNFAKYTNPTPRTSELFQNITWPIVHNDTMQYLNINQTLELRQHLGGEPYAKWKTIYETYGRKPFITF